jgi:Uma2 family endonuclease
MSVISIPAEQRVVLHNVSWETYERILSEHASSSAPRFTFDHGELEIMTLSAEHERYSRRIGDLVGVLADEMDLEIENLGSTTFRREDFERGFEPDSCFYIGNVERVAGKDQLDMTVDPPPDLVVEVDITSPSIGKLPIFAEFGVSGVWRFHNGRLSMFRLGAGNYDEVPESEFFPGLTAIALSELLERGRKVDGTSWLRLVRAWAREQCGR